jgi:hypothetical protein
MSKKSVIRKPYPLDLRFTEEEQRFYDNDKAYIDTTAKELNNPKQGEVIIIRDPMRKSVSYKKANQLRWDKGIGRPYSFNEDLILVKMIKIKETIQAEQDEDKKDQQKRVLSLLMPKLKEAKVLDKVEAERNKQETAGMEEYDTIDRDVVERRQDKERERQYEEDERRREKEKEDKRLAEEARLKAIEDKKAEEKAARKEAALVPQRKQFKQIIDYATKETGITGRINLNMIDVENRTALYYPTQNIWYNPDPNERRSFRIRKPEPNERATGDNFLGQAKYILKQELLKLLLYKKIGENSSDFKRDLKKWLEMNEALGIEDEYEYYEFNRSGGFGDNWKYGVIYTTKTPTKEELIKDKWKEPLKVKLRISSELFNDNFFLQTLDKMGEDGKLKSPEDWRAEAEAEAKAKADREERDRLAREERKKPKTKEQVRSEIEILGKDIEAIRDNPGIFGMSSSKRAEVVRSETTRRNQMIKDYEEKFGEPYNRKAERNSKMDEINERLDTLEAFGYLPDWAKQSKTKKKKAKAVEAEEKEGTGIIDNPELYEEAVAYADNIFKKPSAFKSGFIVKKYKELGGTYSGEKPNKTGIARWFKEEWKDVGNQEYPVFRPTKRITKDTPLTPEEIKPANLKKQIALKQELKGDANLPPFEPKVGGKVVALGVQAEKIPKQDEIWKWSNPEKVADNARKYLGDMAVVFRSTKPKKKYMIFDPVNKKWVFFGEINYEDFTKHQDPKRRENYLTRTASMKGNWKNNKYSANNLSRNILW